MASEDDKSNERYLADEDSFSDSTVDSEAATRYAALRNHKIRFEDAIDPKAERVYKISKQDVVFGRGRGHQKHPGNKRMRSIVEKYKLKYHELNRDGKRKLVKAVYDEISENGVRFLSKLKTLDDKDVWVVVDRPIALQKVCHTLRCRKSILKHVDDEGNLPGAAGWVPPASSGRKNQTTKNRAEATTAPSAAAFRSPAVAGVGFVPPYMHPYFPPPSFGPSLADLEAQRLIALNRFRALTGMPHLAPHLGPPGMEYYEMMRKQQLIQETTMLQQMGDAIVFNGSAKRSSPESSLPQPQVQAPLGPPLNTSGDNEALPNRRDNVNATLLTPRGCPSFHGAKNSRWKDNKAAPISLAGAMPFTTIQVSSLAH
eukprot:scaffold2299_cov131-Cylindrotheca_fusiformis.AAC.38